MEYKVAAILAAAILAATTHANLVQNGGFEDPDIYDAWNIAVYQGETPMWSVINDGHTGSNSFRTTANQSTPEKLMQNHIPLQIGTTYEVSFWIKNFGVGDDYLRAVIIDENGDASLNQSPISTELETWERLAFTYTAEGIDASIWIDLGDSNGVQIDDISVEAVPEPSLMLMVAGLAALAAKKRRR